MGFFGGTVTYVSSVAYNLAGDEAERPNYLKSLVVGNVLNNNGQSIAESLTQGYQNSPMQRLRKFYRWAFDNYTLMDQKYFYGEEFDDLETEVLDYLPKATGATVEVTALQSGGPDPAPWADQWVLQNYPDRYDTDWLFGYSGGIIQVDFNDDELGILTFAPEDYVLGESYLYVYYNEIGGPPGDPRRVWIYKFGSGIEALDDTSLPPLIYQGFLAPIPVRINNVFVSPEKNITEYNLVKKAYRKATGNSIDDLIEKIADNESLGDIDYATVMFGVSLNVVDNSCRKYLYELFRSIMMRMGGTMDAYLASVDAWKEWVYAQQNPVHVLYGTPEPTIIAQPDTPQTVLEFRNTWSDEVTMHIKIGWQDVAESFGSGLKKPGAKTGEVWLETLAPEGGMPVFAIYHQLTQGHWRQLKVYNLIHENHIYNGELVRITAAEALDDVEETGFILPLDYTTIGRMSAVDTAQMSTACQFIVFNCYKVVKLKWYQTGFFKVILIVAIIATVALTGGFSASAVGVLGANAAVGAAIGFTGIAAVIAGVVANAVAAMIITAVITKGATAIFGAKIGAVIGVIASILVINGLTNMSAGNGFAINFGSISRADTLVKMTSAVSQAYTGYTKASVESMVEKTNDLLEDYKDEAKRISDLYAANIGYGRGVIDPMTLTDAAGVWFESPDAFFGRTLMTGSDIAELTLDMVSNFTDLSISTDLNLA